MNILPSGATTTILLNIKIINTMAQNKIKNQAFFAPKRPVFKKIVSVSCFKIKNQLSAGITAEF
jgi:hypothetical protein